MMRVLVHMNKMRSEVEQVHFLLKLIVKLCLVCLLSLDLIDH